MKSSFTLLKQHDSILEELAERVEANYQADPNTCLIKIRQLAEQIVKRVIDDRGVYFMPNTSFRDKIDRLRMIGAIPSGHVSRLHYIRMAGNDAVHEVKGNHRVAAQQLRNLYEISIWYEGQFGDPDAIMPRFVLPPAPVDASPALKEALQELEDLQQQLAESKEAHDIYEEELSEQAEQLALPSIFAAQQLSSSFSCIPKKMQKKIKGFITDFLKIDTHPEMAPFDNVVDHKFSWVPFQHSYGMVVANSPNGDVILCLWAGKLKDAQAWVRLRRVEVHPELGTLQIFAEVPEQPPATQGLFSKYSDPELLTCGIPRVLIPAVRSVATSRELVALAEHLPTEASDVLFGLVEGKSIAEALEAAGISKPRHSIDVQDFDVALGGLISKQRFKIISDGGILAEILDASLEEWRVFLHPVQQKIVTRGAKGPMRVLGGAGTGKTVVLMHRAVYLLKKVFTDPDERILITTYTKNLAADLAANMDNLLDPETRRRVDVVNLHQWVLKFSGREGKSTGIIDQKQRKTLMGAAIKSVSGASKDFKSAFYREEWEQVVQAQEILDKKSYLRAKRTGRGTKLNRGKRIKIWKVFEAYRKGLNDRGFLEWTDLINRTRDILNNSPEKREYCALLVDEVQDCNISELKLLRAMVDSAPYDMFMVGDNYQRIYGASGSFSACGIAIKGRSHRLKVNYRTTDLIRSVAVSVFDNVGCGDMDGGQDNLKGYHSLRLGEAPQYHLSSNQKNEHTLIIKQVQSWIADGVRPEDICVAARTHSLVKVRATAFSKANLQYSQLTNESLEKTGPGIRLATMHRLKGTEFRYVLLSGVHLNTVPLLQKSDHLADAVSIAEFDKSERCLFYVAATRARDLLLITGFGERSIFIPGEGTLS